MKGENVVTKGQILVVEDDEIAAEVLQYRLQTWGYTVSALASSGDEAVERAADSQPDLVLMDIALNGSTDGVEAAKQIRGRFDIPVIYLTAHADEKTLQRAKMAEPFGYIIKPFNDRELYSTIEMALYKHKMESKLKKMDRWLAAVLKSIGDGVIATDSVGVITFMNPLAEELTGWAQEDALGKDCMDVFKAVDARTRSPLEGPVALAAREILITGWTDQTILIAQDGRETPIAHSTAPIKDDSDQIAGVVLAFRDITGLRQAERKLLESNRNLEGALDELRRTQEQIVRQERLRALGEMASGIAHEVNNALAPVMGFSELLLVHPQDLDDKEWTTYCLQTIHTAAKDAAAIVSRLREFYRFREDDETFLPVDLNQLVAQAISLAQPKWKDQPQARGITIGIKADLQATPLVTGNEAELREVLINLIFNAVDAMPDGGMITIRTCSDGESVLLEVSDTGVGMSDEVRERCWEPFFTTKGERGTGLGLAMVQGIVQKHSGAIGINSEAGKGTTITIRLPLRKQKTAGERLSLAANPAAHPQRVLLVEDEPRVRQLLAQYLARDGHTVETAMNGRDGLEKFSAGEFDLVITDRAMPEMSGDHLAAAIKNVAPETPVILITGFGELMNATGERPDGVEVVLGKPVTLAALRQAIVGVLTPAEHR
jgi:PAS domain S-box-containing protein